MNAVCVNNDGSFECKCKEGWAGNGQQCRGKRVSYCIIGWFVLCSLSQMLMSARMGHMTATIMQNVTTLLVHFNATVMLVL